MSLLRSTVHLQTLLCFLAVGLVVSAESLSSLSLHFFVESNTSPPVEFLSIPFILSYCLLVGMRFAFEIPLDLQGRFVLAFKTIRLKQLQFVLDFSVPLLYAHGEMHPEKVDSAWRPELSEMVVRLVRSDEQRRYQQLMRAHHYLGYLPKIGETLWYVATWREQWLALLSFSGSALKCAVRDRWIGWTLRQHYGRLKLVVNNSRFLILPDGHFFNLGSRVLSLCQRRLPGDWEEAFGHGVVLLETFVDPQRHRGTVYRAANWMYVGNTRGYRRTHGGYTATPQTPKMVFAA